MKPKAMHALLRGSNVKVEHKKPQRFFQTKPIFKERPREMHLYDVSYRLQNSNQCDLSVRTARSQPRTRFHDAGRGTYSMISSDLLGDSYA